MDAEFFERKVPNYVLLILFFFGLVFLKAALSLKFPSPWVFADEAVYSETASNILDGIFFSKLQYCQTYPPGYSLVLSLAYFISNNESTTYHIMQLINCVLTSSIIFPAYFILETYTSKTIAFLASILISVLPSVSLYTFAIMSENVFIPLFAFSFWFLIESYKGRGKYWDFLAGFSIFYLFLTKTMGLAMIIGFIASFFFFSKSKSRFTSFSYILKENGLLLSSLLIPFIIWKLYAYLLIPVGVGSYNSASYLTGFINNLGSLQDFYTLMSLFIHEAEFLIWAAYFVVFSVLLMIISSLKLKKLQISFPDSKWNSLDEVNKIALKSSLVYFLGSFIIVMTICVAHMSLYLNGNPYYLIFGRYLDPIVPLVFILGLMGVELLYTNDVGIKSKLAVTIYIIINILFIFTFPYEYYKFPNMLSIFYIQYIKNEMSIPMQIFIPLYLSFCFISSYIYINNKRAKVYILIIFTIISLILSSYAFGIEVHHSIYSNGKSPIGIYLNQNCNKNTTILVDNLLHLPNSDVVMWFATQFWTRGRLNITPTAENLSNIGAYCSRPCYVISSRDLPFKPLACSTPDYKLYLFNPKLLPEIYWLIDSGFYNSENWSGTATRWMQADANILVNSLENSTATLSLNAHSFYRNRTLEVSAGDELLTKATIPSDGFVEIEASIRLVKGANALRLRVPEGCERPSDKPELKSSDERCLSVAIQNITLSERKSVQLDNLIDFYDIENWSSTPTRWMQADASLLVNSSENRTANLSLNAQSFHRNRTLEVSSGDAPAAQFAVPTSFINVSVPIHLAKGANTVRFHVSEGCERPSDIKELSNPDSRCLSVAVQNLSVT